MHLLNKPNLHTPFFRGLLIAILCFGLLIAGLKLAVTSVTSFGGDFYVYWQSGRAAFIHNVSPYDPSTTRTIQQGFYGELAAPDEDQLAFVYPPFSLLLVLPVVGLTYAWAQAYWMALNIVLVFAATFNLYKKPPIWWIASLIFFYPVVRSVILGSFSLIIGAGLFLAYALLHSEDCPPRWKQILAGFILAWCAMKPHLTWLIIFFLLVQSFRKQTWSVFLGFAGSGMVLMAISWMMVPTWVIDWIKAIVAYTGYVPNDPIIFSWINSLGINTAGLGVTVILILVALTGTILISIYWWRRTIPDFVALGWLILINQLVNPNPYSMVSDQIVFLLPLLIWMSRSNNQNHARGLVWFIFVLIPWVLFGIYLNGKEPYAVASGLAFLYVIWWSGVLIGHLIKRQQYLPSNEIAGL